MFYTKDGRWNRVEHEEKLMSDMKPKIALPSLWLAIALPAGCSNPLKDEQERLAMVENIGSVEEVCEQSRKVADAALSTKDEQYSLLHTMADVDCLTAEQNPGASYRQITTDSANMMKADNMDTVGDDARANLQ